MEQPTAYSRWSNTDKEYMDKSNVTQISHIFRDGDTISLQELKAQFGDLTLLSWNIYN